MKLQELSIWIAKLMHGGKSVFTAPVLDVSCTGCGLHVLQKMLACKTNVDMASALRMSSEPLSSEICANISHCLRVSQECWTHLGRQAYHIVDSETFLDELFCFGLLEKTDEVSGTLS